MNISIPNFMKYFVLVLKMNFFTQNNLDLEKKSFLKSTYNVLLQQKVINFEYM